MRLMTIPAEVEWWEYFADRSDLGYIGGQEPKSHYEQYKAAAPPCMSIFYSRCILP